MTKYRLFITIFIVPFTCFILSCSGNPDSPENVSNMSPKEAIDFPVIPENPAKEESISWRNPALAARTAGLRTVNLGNALEAPREGEWGMILEESYFYLIAEAGFNGVRIPVKWSAHAEKSAPYKIDLTFFERIDWVLDMCEKYDLLAILNMHHYDEIFISPHDHKDRFMALWEQIAQRYQSRPIEFLWFELLNEPHGTLVFPIWNEFSQETLKVVRQTNPDRPVMIGGGDWNSYTSLITLKLTPEDPNLIATFHYYLPHTFTHQGAEWNEGSENWMGNEWNGNDRLVEGMAKHFSFVYKWMVKNGIPVYLGEFGAYNKCPVESRLKWTYAVPRLAEAYGFGWGYWEFGAGFGIYDREKKIWRQDLAEALYPSGNFQ
jgi:endoglucanase